MNEPKKRSLMPKPGATKETALGRSPLGEPPPKVSRALVELRDGVDRLYDEEARRIERCSKHGCTWHAKCLEITVACSCFECIVELGIHAAGSAIAEQQAATLRNLRAGAEMEHTLLVNAERVMRAQEEQLLQLGEMERSLASLEEQAAIGEANTVVGADTIAKLLDVLKCEGGYRSTEDQRIIADARIVMDALRASVKP